MPLPRERAPSSIKVRQIKLALGGRCELCSRECPLDLLEIHAISPDRLRGQEIPNLEREILVLCSSCHRDVHAAALSRAEQKEILRYRQAGRRREIRRILCYTPKPCVPPEPDIPEIYEEANRVSTRIFGV